MKKLSTIFGLLMLVAVAFSSCGSDDDKTEYVLSNALCKHTHALSIADAEAQVTTSPTNVSLDDMLKAYDYVSPITGGVMSLTDGTTIKITGLKEGVVLQGFTLTINDSQKTFGDITSDKAELYNDTNLQYFKDVFNKMVSQRKLTVKASYKPNVKITDEDALKIEIVFKGNFTYLK